MYIILLQHLIGITTGILKIPIGQVNSRRPLLWPTGIS
jgi:hypothetical protein